MTPPLNTSLIYLDQFSKLRIIELDPISEEFQCIEPTFVIDIVSTIEAYIIYDKNPLENCFLKNNLDPGVLDYTCFRPTGEIIRYKIQPR